MPRQSDPETERKRAWLNRYRESLAEQRRIAEQLEEARDRSTSISVSLNPAKSAPTGSHSDRVADSVQRIAALESKLQDEQCRGQNIAVEIIDAAYKLPIKYAQVLCKQYLDFLTAAQTGDKINLSTATVLHYRSAALAALTIPEDYRNED